MLVANCSPAPNTPSRLKSMKPCKKAFDPEVLLTVTSNVACSFGASRAGQSHAIFVVQVIRVVTAGGRTRQTIAFSIDGRPEVQSRQNSVTGPIGRDRGAIGIRRVTEVL